MDFMPENDAPAERRAKVHGRFRHLRVALVIVGVALLVPSVVAIPIWGIQGLPLYIKGILLGLFLILAGYSMKKEQGPPRGDPTAAQHDTPQP